MTYIQRLYLVLNDPTFSILYLCFVLFVVILRESHKKTPKLSALFDMEEGGGCNHRDGRCISQHKKSRWFCSLLHRINHVVHYSSDTIETDAFFSNGSVAVQQQQQQQQQLLVGVDSTRSKIGASLSTSRQV
jgi:hypothetical protein